MEESDLTRSTVVNALISQVLSAKHSASEIDSELVSTAANSDHSIAGLKSIASVSVLESLAAIGQSANDVSQSLSSIVERSRLFNTFGPYGLTIQRGLDLLFSGRDTMTLREVKEMLQQPHGTWETL